MEKMGSTSVKRVCGLFTTGFFALSAAAMAAAPPAVAPEVGDQPGLRPLERLAAALPAGRKAVAAPAHGDDVVRARSVGAAVAGRTVVRKPQPELVFPDEAAPDYGAGDAGFGAGRSGHSHEGQDVFAPAGTPLVAARDAVVLETGDDGGRGNYITVYSAEKRETYMYLHMQSPSPLSPGERVDAGDPVGRVGCTGSCWGDHLHFEVRLGRGSQARPVDPLPLLRRAERG
jgi:murein DD-endopeptidase MepM/ murein hydrolase activator NlpD